jgi:hypothetical protein
VVQEHQVKVLQVAEAQAVQHHHLQQEVAVERVWQVKLHQIQMLQEMVETVYLLLSQMPLLLMLAVEVVVYDLAVQLVQVELAVAVLVVHKPLVEQRELPILAVEVAVLETTLVLLAVLVDLELLFCVGLLLLELLALVLGLQQTLLQQTVLFHTEELLQAQEM